MRLIFNCTVCETSMWISKSESSMMYCANPYCEKHGELLDIPEADSEEIILHEFTVEYRTVGGSCHDWNGPAIDEDEAEQNARDASYQEGSWDNFWHSLVSITDHGEYTEEDRP